MTPLTPEEFEDVQEEAPENADIQQFDSAEEFNTYVAADSATNTRRRYERDDRIGRYGAYLIIAVLALKGAEEYLARY
ncbi:hypothetical protein [Halobaculum magnesiiphilum]|uniref:Uncharacterized protein n=1 Tax=Halobaculum magnesiiphilum TaxID=1017351 RepID=A0A8T8WDB7_9EURY|nr:hypothetical protein [Halobaculum magnesiiphilum]QZP37763.1 hypothetical protein K6T50_00855 [Halobaculum magnesiiphilum]